MMTKYMFEFNKEDIDVNVRRLTNQLWKLIPMREHDEDWPKQLDTVIVEIAGLNDIFVHPHFHMLISHSMKCNHQAPFQALCKDLRYMMQYEPCSLQ